MWRIALAAFMIIFEKLYLDLPAPLAEKSRYLIFIYFVHILSGIGKIMKINKKESASAVREITVFAIDKE